MGSQRKIITPRVILQVLLSIVLIPSLPLLISWHWNWWEASLYAVFSILSFAISSLLAARRHPDIIVERAHYMQYEDAKLWDKQLAPFIWIGGIVMMVVAGLDQWFRWPPTYSLLLKILAGFIIVTGYSLTSYALIENRFFSGMVRLQIDRGHQVVSNGPYQWVRHPGYAGAILTYLATPIFLDSSWAFLPAVFTIILLVIRTAKEDQFLLDELKGYHDYAKQVHYRLLPGIW